ncbi:hypothetical protein QM012_007010 [Aureobasidium pullulans]|uniref:Uncharacterized protein n=1 Tax=Aureobasidium pullulans TaxID=5580 RepID=A0ABR0TQ89_AURPU
MFSSLLTSSFLLLVSSALADAAGFATRDPTGPTCSGFGIILNKTTPLSSQDLIISTGVVCNVRDSNFSTPCNVLSGGWPTLQNVIMYMNGTRVSDSYAVGYALWNATGDSNALYGGDIAAVENQTVTFDNGTSGNVIFTPTYRCITGRVQGCSSNVSIVDGTEVNACYPEFTDRVVSFESAPGHFENITVLAGSRSINETSAQAAANLKQNPNEHPPYGLLSSGAGAGPKMMGAGATIASVIVVTWLGMWIM